MWAFEFDSSAYCGTSLTEERSLQWKGFLKSSMEEVSHLHGRTDWPWRGKTRLSDRCCKGQCRLPLRVLFGESKFIKSTCKHFQLWKLNVNWQALLWEPYRHLWIPRFMSEFFTHYPSNVKRKAYQTWKKNKFDLFFFSAHAGTPVMVWHPIQSAFLTHTHSVHRIGSRFTSDLSSHLIFGTSYVYAKPDRTGQVSLQSRSD